MLVKTNTCYLCYHDLIDQFEESCLCPRHKNDIDAYIKRLDNKTHDKKIRPNITNRDRNRNSKSKNLS